MNSTEKAYRAGSADRLRDGLHALVVGHLLDVAELDMHIPTGRLGQSLPGLEDWEKSAAGLQLRPRQILQFAASPKELLQEGDRNLPQHLLGVEHRCCSSRIKRYEVMRIPFCYCRRVLGQHHGWWSRVGKAGTARVTAPYPARPQRARANVGVNAMVLPRGSENDLRFANSQSAKTRPGWLCGVKAG